MWPRFGLLVQVAGGSLGWRSSGRAVLPKPEVGVAGPHDGTVLAAAGAVRPAGPSAGTRKISVSCSASIRNCSAPRTADPAQHRCRRRRRDARPGGGGWPRRTRGPGRRWCFCILVFGHLSGRGWWTSSTLWECRRRGSRRGRPLAAGDHPAKAESTAHTERAASSGSCMPATIQAKPVPRQPAHRVIPKECETRIRDGPTARQAGSQTRSRSAPHQRGGRSPRREHATRP